MNDDSDATAESFLRDDADDVEYLLKRAGDHQQLAENATDSGSRAIHLRFSKLYEERARPLRLVLLD